LPVLTLLRATGSARLPCRILALPDFSKAS
jgi:hypothetical protein